MIQLNNLLYYADQGVPASTVSAGGSITLAGALANVITIPEITTGGTITLQGDIPLIQVGLNDFKGSITVSGALATSIVQYPITIDGEITLQGSISNQANKTLSGSITMNGSLLVGVSGGVSVAGSITMSGVVTPLKLSVGGGTSSQGAIRRRRR